MSTIPLPLPHHRARVFTDLHDVISRLERIELQIDWVIEATRQGHLARLLSTDFDFPGHAEYNAASRGLRTLAEVAAPDLLRDTFLGIPVVTTGTGSVVLAVTAGDLNTGMNGDDDPRTRSLKGPATVRAASFPRLRLGEGEYDEELGVEFWYLLTYATPLGGVRAEVSLPDIPVADDYVARWRERIIIGDIDLGGSVERRIPPAVPAAPPVSVSRKRGAVSSSVSA